MNLTDWSYIHTYIQKIGLIILQRRVNPNRQWMQESQLFWGCIRKRIQGRSEAPHVPGPSQVIQLPYHPSSSRTIFNLLNNKN